MSRQLRSAFGHYATGVTVITTRGAAGEPVGITANSFSSLSLDPPLVLWSIAHTSSNYEAFRAAGCFAVHVLHAGQGELARVFSTRNIDRFAGVPTSAGASGAPLLPDFHARFDCETHAQYEGGDHLIIVGRVLAVEERAGVPLLFYRGRFAAVAEPPAAV
ncbi:MAG: flavin reductase family protein [Steroidobacteraceae bacterium]|jgi:flavin reductase (DIM6/NTAB) family NADH-FMN oxidoreductase RutF|nr:flavin reductase family protein [Steroidobacteraceae bacterium]